MHCDGIQDPARLFAEAIALSRAGDVDPALRACGDAIAIGVRDQHPDLWTWRLQLAALLFTLEQRTEAVSECRRAVDDALRQSGSEASFAAVSARLFLAELLLKAERYAEVLPAVEPSLATGSEAAQLLYSFQALALWQLDRHDDAREAAKKYLAATNQLPTTCDRLRHITRSFKADAV